MYAVTSEGKHIKISPGQSVSCQRFRSITLNSKDIIGKSSTDTMRLHSWLFFQVLTRFTNTMMTQDELEQKIVDKGLTAPRITPDSIDANIIGEDYYVFPGTTTTVCLLTLKNGYKVVGDSTCVLVENFDEEIGRNIARNQAREKLWPLMGYELRQTIHEGRA